MDSGPATDPELDLDEAEMRAREGRLSPSDFESLAAHLEACQSSSTTQSQQTAIDFAADPNSVLCIRAGPGSGKTHTVSRRTAALIRSGIQPSEILVLSMTNRAVGALADSLQPLLKHHVSSVNLFTFHSFCAMLVADYGHLHFNTPKRRFLSDYAWDKLNSLFSGRLIGFKGETVKGKITPKKLAKLLQMVKARQISIPEAATSNNISEDYVEALVQYLDTNGVVRYPDLIADAQDLLRLSRLRPIARVSKYKVLIVDEFQDMHPHLMLLVCAVMAYPSLPRALSIGIGLGDGLSNQVQHPSPRHLTLAGDPHQCIYEFLGADPEVFKNLASQFPSASVNEITLADTFRLTPEILNAVTTSIVLPLLEAKTTNITLVKPATAMPVIYATDSPAMEAQFVASEIVRLIATLGGLLTFADFAILTRTNAELAMMQRTLTRDFGIPVQLLATPVLWTDSSLHLLLDILHVLKGGPGSDLSLIAIINALDTNSGASRRVANVFNNASAHPGSIEDWLRPHLALPRAKRVVYKLNSEEILATQISKFLDAVSKERSNLAALESPEGILSLLLRIARAASLLPALNTDPESLHDRLANFARALSSSHRRYSPSSDSSFVDHFLLLLHDEPTPVMCQSKVNLSTVHTAKGLEFPVVFMLGCAPVVVGLSQLKWHSLLTNILLSNPREARVFYVGCTRTALLLYVGSTPKTCDSLLPQVNRVFSKSLPNLSSPSALGAPILNAIAQGLNRPVPSPEKINRGHVIYARMNRSIPAQPYRQLHTTSRKFMSVARWTLARSR